MLPTIIESIFLGLCLAVLFYNFTKYILNADKAILFYSLFMLSLVSLAYFSPSSALFNQVLLKFDFIKKSARAIEILSGAGMVIFFLMLCAHVAQENDWRPDIQKIIYLLCYCFIIDLLLSFWQFTVESDLGESSLFLIVSYLRTIFIYSAIVFMLFIITIYLRSKKTTIRYLGISALFFSIGGLILSLLDHFPTIINNSKANYNFFLMMCFFQMVVFAYFLNYREYLIEKEKQRLQSLNTFKSRFFTAISHEFRTPLTLISGPASDLLKSTGNSVNLNKVKFIHNGANKILKVINELLDLAKLDANAMPVKEGLYDLISLVKEVMFSLSNLAEFKNIQLSLKSNQTVLWLYFDHNHFEKIIYNLVTNALKYTPENGKVIIEIAVDSTRKELIINVKDTGIGIPEELLPHIFDWFYQVDSENDTSNLPSSGIGLSLVKELVTLNGGSIKVVSAPNKGSTFSISFPLNAANPLSSQPKESPSSFIKEEVTLANNDTSYNDPSQKPLVLLVEDDQQMAAYIEESLSNAFNVLMAPDGSVGVQKAIAQVPNLIITDVMMPEKDGYTLTKELKLHKATSHIPIIILTGKKSSANKIKGYEVDADEYLTKPFDAALLLSRVNNLLRNRLRLQEYYRANLWILTQKDELSSQDEIFLREVLGVVELNYSNESFTVEELSNALHLSRTQLYNKLKALVGVGPKRFIRSYRLQRAKQMLEQHAGTVSEIAFAVGFRDVSYFSRCFKEEFKYRPSATKNS